MNVKELKDLVNGIPENLDNREVVIPGFGGGYNPLNSLTYSHIKVEESYPTDKKDKKTKLAVVLELG